MKFSKNERLLMIITAAVLIFAVYFQFIYSPKAKQVAKEWSELQSTKSSLAQSQIKLRSLAFLKKSTVRFLPKDALIETIIVHASKYPGIQVTSVTPTTDGKMLKVEVVCSGALRAFMDYLRSFDNMNLPMQIESVKMVIGRNTMTFKLVLVSYFL